MKPEQTVTALEEDLNALNKKIEKLGKLAIAQFSGAIDGMATFDTEHLNSIISQDKLLDDLELSINDDAFLLISLRAPVVTDLRRVIVAIKISSILERVGDYAKNIAKRSKILAEQGSDTIPGVNIGRMGQLAEEMLTEVINAYLTRDVSKAIKIRDRDLEIDYMYTAFYREILTSMARNPEQISNGTHLLFIAKNIERIGDYATGIAEQIYFLIHGTTLEDDRPKADPLTSSNKET
ncbi:MAG: phosphate transport system protein [Paracoccaceae bacterium]|jgi:phosphate transport system protein